MRRRRSPGLTLLVLLLAATACAAAMPAIAAAHAVLESSDPASGASAAESPERVVLTFSEAADPELSLVTIVDAEGDPVPDVTEPQAVAGDRTSLEVTLGTPLEAGVYTVNWRAVSSVDGHVKSGAFAFGVGQTPAADSAVVVELVHTSAWASALADIGRWLLYASIVVMIGGATTSLFVYGARLPRGGITVLRWAAVVAITGLVLMIWSQKMLVGAPSLLPLFVIRQGMLLLGLGTALGLGAVAIVLVDFWPARWSLWLLAGSGSAAALLHVMAGHAAAPGSLLALNVAAQWVHFTAIGVWVGGLFWLLLGFRTRDPEGRAAAVGIFTRVATAVLVVVLATGLVRAFVEIGSLSALVDTRYGQTLLVKVALAGVLVGLGALNHFFWAPAVRDGRGDRAGRRFGLNSRGELAVAFGVLAATAVLTNLVPGRVDAVAGAADPVPSAGITVTGTDYATSVRVTLSLTPGVAGRNEYVLRAVDYDTGEPLTDVVEAGMRCSLPERPEMAPVTVRLEPEADGAWGGAGLDFSGAGLWTVEVYLQEADGGTTVPLELEMPAAAP
ncbi:MAG: copper resistance protein CopC/CopD [Actinobacteria bacterium]|nr:copper resistance protein CopC/CopD [Actinomycetota bacterium]